MDVRLQHVQWDRAGLKHGVVEELLSGPPELRWVPTTAEQPADRTAVQETGADSLKQMGAVVKAARAKLEGQAIDGKVLSDKVRDALNAKSQ